MLAQHLPWKGSAYRLINKTFQTGSLICRSDKQTTKIMKKILITLLCATAGFVGTVAAQDKGGTAPQFKFKEGDTHDFGKVKKGPVAEHTFEFTNTGKEPLIIQDVTPSCSCTKVDWDKQPILPGKVGHSTLGVKTSELTGVFNKGVYIRSNAFVPNGEKRYTIYLKGEAIGN